MKKKLGSGRKRRNRALRAHAGARRVSVPRVVSGILITLLIIFLFNRLGPLHKLQTFVLDVKMRLSDPPQHSDVAVVKIKDEDYQNIFGGRSPLDPAALRRVIDAIALGRPKVIGVDIDTSALQFRDFQPGKNWPPVIWEREAKEIPESVEYPVEMLDVLGGQNPALNADSGLALFIPDHEDRVVRRYRRHIHTTEGPFPTLMWALVRRFAPGSGEGPEDTDDRFIAYAGDGTGSHRFNLSASQALELGKEGSLPNENPFKDKIVLLGGTYLHQDEHQTPLGHMHGVEVMAQVLETELQGGGDKVPNKATILILEVFEGALVVLLFQFFHRYKFGLALVLNLLALFTIAFLCSLMSFGSPLRLTYFLPLLLCVLIYEFAIEYRIDLVKKLGELLGKDKPKAR